MPPSVFFQKCSDNYQILTTFEAPNGEHSFSLPEILIRQKNIEKCLFKKFSTQLLFLPNIWLFSIFHQYILIPFWLL